MESRRGLKGRRNLKSRSEKLQKLEKREYLQERQSISNLTAIAADEEEGSHFGPCLKFTCALVLLGLISLVGLSYWCSVNKIDVETNPYLRDLPKHIRDLMKLSFESISYWREVYEPPFVKEETYFLGDEK